MSMRVFKFAGVAASTVLGAVSATAAYGSLSRTSQLFGPSVYRGPGRRRSVALTFDDGPSEGTLPILEYLDREQVWATFFQCGMNVRRCPQAINWEIIPIPTRASRSSRPTLSIMKSARRRR